MPDNTPHPYGLTPEHYTQVADELRRAEAYFERLRDELRDKAADTAKHGPTIANAQMVIDEIKRLRFELKREQGWRGNGTV